MECNIEDGMRFDLGSLSARFQGLTDQRAARGLRYQLENLLTFMVLAKLCGEDRPSGIAEWVAHRIDKITAALRIERKSAPHHSTDRRVLADMVEIDEIEKIAADYLAGKKHFGRQVVLAIDGKMLRGSASDEQSGLQLLAAYLPNEGIVLMEMEVESHENEIPVAPKVLQCVDLRNKVVIGDALHTQRKISASDCYFRGRLHLGLQRVISPKSKKIFAYGLSQMSNPFLVWDLLRKISRRQPRPTKVTAGSRNEPSPSAAN